MVLNFGKNVQKGGKRVGVISNPKKSMQIYAYSQFFAKKTQRNFSKLGGGEVNGRLDFFQKHQNRRSQEPLGRREGRKKRRAKWQRKREGRNRENGGFKWGTKSGVKGENMIF